MRSKISLYRVILIALILETFSICYALGNENSPMYLLKLSSVGFPTAEKQKDAWKIIELKIFNGKLYLGHGDATVNTGPTDVIYFDLKTEKFVTEFTVEDEAIHKYQIVDGKLVIPGVDATEEWELGNIYVLTDSGWTKHRSLTHGIHVFEVASFNKKWYAATGSYFEFGKDEEVAFGGILCSEDQGKTWQLVYATPSDGKSTFRVRSLIPYRGKLYAFIYAYTEMKKEEIPEEHRPYLGGTYEGKHLIFADGLFGVQEAIVYDGKRWQYIDLIQKPHICLISPFVFKDKLVMSVLSGEYIDYIRYATKGGIPEREITSLYVFDGRRTEELPLEYDLLRDVVVKEDRLFLLVLKDKHYFIAETPDLKRWKYYVFPQSINNPKSIEHDGKSFYIGMQDGNIFKSTDMERITDLSQTEDHKPRKIYGAAELPRDGKWYWAAITGWTNWGKLAKISCQIKPGNIIDVTTSNIAAFNIFVPFVEIDETKPLTLNIGGQQEFRGQLDGCTELLCKYTEGAKWEVEKGEGSAGTFKYSKKIIGEAEVDLTRTGDDPLIGRWKADVIKWAASADIGIIVKGGIRKDLSRGDIALEDLFDLNYRNSVCTFKTKGEVLRRMMNFNIKLPERERCQVSGFTVTYKVQEEPENNSVVECSLDPEKEYIVATSDFLSKRAKRFFGKEVEYEDIGLQVTEAMIQWFKQYEKIKKIQPKIE